MLVDKRVIKFFETSVYGLVSMLQEYSKKAYDTVDDKYKYVLKSFVETGMDGISRDCISLTYRGMYIKFNVTHGELIPVDLKNIDYKCIKRTTAVVEDCVANLSNYIEPINKIEGHLDHDIRGIDIEESVVEMGSIDVKLL